MKFIERLEDILKKEDGIKSNIEQSQDSRVSKYYAQVLNIIKNHKNKIDINAIYTKIIFGDEATIKSTLEGYIKKVGYYDTDFNELTAQEFDEL